MNFKQWLLTEEQLFNEDFKTQRERFIKQGIKHSYVDVYLSRFEDIIKSEKNYPNINDPIYGLEHIKNRKNIDNYSTFQELKTFVNYVKPIYAKLDAIAEKNKGKFDWTEKDFIRKKKFDNLFNKLEKINSFSVQNYRFYHQKPDFFRQPNDYRLLWNFIGKPYVASSNPYVVFRLFHKLGKFEGIIERIKKYPHMINGIIEQWMKENSDVNLSKEEIISNPSLLDKVIKKWIKNAMSD